ncbi:hypothetical protein JOC83_002489 [Bacillus iocasae]|uniref:Photosystem II protein N n=1 Tax=Priestia iocasae TaxID=2291674 RepID=A0ABS2QW60_9BACI|nr:hypothetical protein [Metabacillus iocasae]
MDTMRIVQYVFTFLGVICLGFTYYNMMKKDDKNK